MPESSVFNNIDYKNKTVSKPVPGRINDIDLDNSIYANIADSTEKGIFDLNSISSFTNISQSRDNIYNMIDVMVEDPIISTAINIYTSDACEPNDKGEIVWVESSDKNVLGMVKHLLDQMNIDKNSYKWVNSLIKYGDLYLRLVRKSEFEDGLFLTKPDEKDVLNEDLILKLYKKDDHYAEFLEELKNPAEMFDLQKFGKSVGYIRAHVIPRRNDTELQTIFNYKYDFNQGDIDLYPATDYVHASLEDTCTRTTEEVSITTGTDEETQFNYSVKKGQSILYNVFRIWRELSLLENSVLLNRITKSSIVRTVQVEVGDMEKSDVRVLMSRIKSMIEQKSAISVGNTYEDYTNPGPIENIIYIPTHDGKGNITVGQIGGDVKTDDLVDLNYFKNKLFGAIGIPKQYLGDTEDSTGFNGGSSLALISSQYAKNIKRIQNAYILAITDAINLILLDKGLTSYINEFTIKMQSPTTQEEKDRKENLATTIQNVDSIMRLLDSIENQVTKLNILKSLLSSAISDDQIISYLQEEIDKLQLEQDSVGSAEEGSGEFDFGAGGEGGEFGSSPEEFGAPTEMSMEEPSVNGGVEESEPTPEEAEAPLEDFLDHKGGELLTEDDLPSWSELGISYMDYNK